MQEMIFYYKQLFNRDAFFLNVNLFRFFLLKKNVFLQRKRLNLVKIIFKK
jgi:hypothetical protein